MTGPAEVSVARARPRTFTVCCSAHGSLLQPITPGVMPTWFANPVTAAWNAMGHAAAHHPRTASQEPRSGP